MESWYLPSGVSIDGANASFEERQDGSVQFDVGNLGGGESREILFDIAIEPSVRSVAFGFEVLGNGFDSDASNDVEFAVLAAGNVRDNLNRVLVLTLRSDESVSGDVSAEVIGVAESDPDSTPNNAATFPLEDDGDSVQIRVSPRTHIYVRRRRRIKREFGYRRRSVGHGSHASKKFSETEPHVRETRMDQKGRSPVFGFW